MGQSGGTLHGVLAVQRDPDLYRAFIGVGQTVSPLEADQIFYQDTLDWANRTGKAELAGSEAFNGSGHAAEQPTSAPRSHPGPDQCTDA